MNLHKKIVFFLSFSLLAVGCNKINDSRQSSIDTCECDLETFPSEKEIIENGIDRIGYSGKIDGTVDFSHLTKWIDTDVNLGLAGENSNITTQTFVEKYVDTHPDISFKANTLRKIYCPKIIQICKSNRFQEEEKFDMIYQLTEEYSKKIEALIFKQKIPTTQPSNPKKVSNPTKKSPRKPTSPEKIFSISGTTDISILTEGNLSHMNFGNVTANWLSQQQIRSSLSLFTTSATRHYIPFIKVGNISSLKDIGTKNVTNCICLIRQEIKMDESELVGEKFITSRLILDMSLLNLSSEERRIHTKEVRGSGITVNRALESLKTNFIYELTQTGFDFSACK
ncbi:MAG: hypothetical protein AAF655_10855 [Bacteroidota bacterium]